MARRPLLATLVTTVVGALMGAILGALVGRFIALFGDATVEVSVPMVFCGTLGYFVGGASAAKGSLDRFGAKRPGLGATVAAIILIGIVGGASVGGRASGVVIAVLGVVAAAIAGVASSAVAKPQEQPVGTNGVRAARPRRAPAEKKPEVADGFADDAPVAAAPKPLPKPAIRKVPVATPEPEAQPEPEVFDSDEGANWSLDDQPSIKPPPGPRPRRDRPLRRGDA